LVFQDPYTSLAPFFRVGTAVAEPLVIAGVAAPDRTQRVLEALSEVGLTPPERYTGRHPHQLSGGERQRVALARALVLRPALIVADEPTAMLDASLRADLLSMMAHLQVERGTTYLFITHDLALAEGFCDRLVVLCNGRVVEQGPTREVLHRPTHPYTAALVDAARRLHPVI
jgi:ABC-type microcin C transport system duplicated ATPase subunit YejF